jgi:hypothetical protein
MATTRRTRTVTKVASAGAGLGLAAVAVLGFSNAAFQAHADNELNNWAAGDADTEITLTTPNQAADAPLFSFGLDGVQRPSSDGQMLAYHDGFLAESFADLNEDASDNAGRTITVNYTGRPAADVRMWVDYDSANVSDDLDENTIVTVTRGAGTAVWSGRLADVPSSWEDAPQASRWLIAPDSGGASETYTVTIVAPPGGVTAGEITGVRFVWEARQA